MTTHSVVHRALVTYSDRTTGEIRVKIPAVLGVSSEITISTIGRSSSNDYWAVPKVGEQIVVSADDENLTNVFWLQTEPYNPGTKEPTGFSNSLDSTISFNSTTRTFTISPVDGNYEVWVRGVKYQISEPLSVVIPDVSGGYNIYFDASCTLREKTAFFDLEWEAPVAYIYWRSPSATIFADERHGTTLDWQTHEYLHRTQGAQYATGFAISNYTTTGTGSTTADMKLDIANGTFYDEDIQVDIVHSSSPIPNTWQQKLQGGAYIPVFYLTSTGWAKTTATQYPVKLDSMFIPQYNSGTSLVTMGNNKYSNSWIVATNNLNEPIIAIMGQAEHSNISGAQDEQWSSLSLSQLPVQEMRPLWKVTFQALGGSAVNGAIRSVTDLRTSIKSTAISTPATVVIPPQTVESVVTRNLLNTDAGKLLTSSANCTLTVTSSTLFSTGQRVDVVRLGGTLTISSSGVTLLYTPANTLRAVNSAASIICLNSSTYLLVGDLG